MVQVFASIFQDEAIVVKSLLESAGLSPELLVDGMSDANPLFSLDIKGSRICVSDDEAADAKAVVADFISRKGSLEDEEE